MRSNFLQMTILTALVTIFLLSCGPGRERSRENEENVIGQSLSSISPVREAGGAQSQTVVAFDETIRKIYQFNLNPMGVTRSLDVLNPGSQHYVLYSGSTNYIVDLSEKHLTIFDRNANPQQNPLYFEGVPKSAAFRPDLGYLVMYDSLQTVGIIKLSSTGQVLNARSKGSVVSGDLSIVSGDIIDNGTNAELILALSDNSIAKVNLDTAVSEAWSPTIMSTTLSNITWIAPIPGSLTNVLIKTLNSVVLFNVSTGTVVETLSIGTNEVIKLSKTYDPHVVVDMGSGNTRVIYTNGLTLKKLDLRLPSAIGYSSSYYPILNSDLDVANDMWTYVYVSSYGGGWLYNDVNLRRDKRRLVRLRLSDKLALKSKEIRDQAQIKLGVDYFFALMPSLLGQAQKYSIMTDEVNTLERFNQNKL